MVHPDLQHLQVSVERCTQENRLTALSQPPLSPPWQLLLRVSGTGQELLLGEDPDQKEELQRLREAQRKGAKITSVTGHVQGWNGRFPDVLKAMAPDAPGGRKRPVLLVTDFEVAQK